ncbi:hypothetical protein COTS27_01623 [Spirochaetota bacterium]|nr:hypothetical protein COTS27_01623 [Spirochaetota bacterium]
MAALKLTPYLKKQLSLFKQKRLENTSSKSTHLTHSKSHDNATKRTLKIPPIPNFNTPPTSTTSSPSNKTTLIKIDIQILENTLNKEYITLGKYFHNHLKKNTPPPHPSKTPPKIKSSHTTIQNLLKKIHKKRRELHSIENSPL